MSSETTASKRAFTSFVAEHFAVMLERHGYRRAAPTAFQAERDRVVRAAAFVLSKDRRRFVPRFNIWLAPFYDELGVTVLRDLPALVSDRPNADWWRWPSSESDRNQIGAQVADALKHVGLPWLDRQSQLPALIEHLESQRYRENADGQLKYAFGELGAAGVVGAHVGGSTAALRVRPEAIRHLSYAYELAGRPSEALAAWQEYCEIFPPSEATDSTRSVKARLEYLAALAGA